MKTGSQQPPTPASGIGKPGTTINGQTQPMQVPASGVANPGTTTDTPPGYAQGMAWTTAPYYTGSTPQAAAPNPAAVNPTAVNPAAAPSRSYQTQPMQVPAAPQAPITGQTQPLQTSAPGQTTPNTVNQIPTGNVPPLVGGDALKGAMGDAQKAAYQNAAGYLDPQWQNDQQKLETKLANQGVGQNSEAWNKAMDDFGRQKQFAYQQAQSNAVSQGNAAQNQMFNQGLMANQNQFGQNLQGGQFTNAVQQQLKAQGFTQQQIDNLEAQHRFDNSMSMRNQDINELLLQQQNPLSMLNALTGGGSVQQPQFTNAPGSNVAGTDIASLMQQYFGNQMSGYNSAVGSQNSMMSGLYGLGAGAMAAPTGTFTGANGLLSMLGISDRRLKKNLVKIGVHEVGTPIYLFDYLWDEPGIGVMADELEKVMPEAVFTLPSGFKAVNYARL